MNYPSDKTKSYVSYTDTRYDSSPQRTSTTNGNGEKKEASRLLSSLSRSYIDQIVKGDIQLLCIDFGHGESTLARMLVKTDVSGKPVWEVVPLNTTETSPKYKHETYIFIPQDQTKERISIGETAHRRAQSGIKGDFYCYFKKMPHQAENFAEPFGGHVVGERVKYGYLMKAFLQAYLDMISTEEMMKYNGLDAKKPVMLMIGRPSGEKWDAAEAAYAKLFEGLTVFGKKPLAIRVLSESFAALAQSVNDSESVEYKHEETVVCVDMGSSTADITCMCRGSVVYEYGISLGAHMIEANLLEYVISEANRKLDRGDRPYTLRDVDGYPMPDFRRYKENYFGDSTREPLPNEKMRLDFDDGVDYDSIVVRLSSNVMDTVCKGMPIQFNDKNAPEGKASYGSWYDACKAFYEKARSDIYALIDRGDIPPIKVVILTGGASRMDFVKALVESTFGDKNEYGRHNRRDFLIYQSREPSYTVSKGLAWISYNAAKTEQILANAKKQIRDTLNQACSYSLYTAVAQEVVSIFYDTCYHEMCLWSKRTQNESLNAVLKNQVNPRCNAKIATEEIRRNIRKAIMTWYDNGGINLQGVMDKMTNYFSEMFGVSLRGITIPLPQDVAVKAATSVSQVNITIDSLPLVQKAIAIFPIFGPFYNLDREDHKPAKREEFTSRFDYRRTEIKRELEQAIAEQLSAQALLQKYLVDFLEAEISAILDQKINDISMYCFKTGSKNQ